MRSAKANKAISAPKSTRMLLRHARRNRSRALYLLVATWPTWVGSMLVIALTIWSALQLPAEQSSWLNALRWTLGGLLPVVGVARAMWRANCGWEDRR